MGGPPTDEEPHDEAFGTRLLDQIFTFWIEPELQRGSKPLDRVHLTHALVVMAPGRPVEVLLNAEAELIADIEPTRDLQAGESVTSEDIRAIRRLHPREIDEDAAWVAMATLGTAV